MMNTGKNKASPYFYIVNVEAAIFNEEKWLMIERSEKEDYGGGLLAFIGGKVDETEDSDDILEKTVIREVYEEVGVEIENQMTYVNSSLFFAAGEAVVDVVFLCKYKSGAARCKSPDEVANVYWMTIEEVRNHPDIPVWLKRNIKLAEEVKKKIYS